MKKVSKSAMIRDLIDKGLAGKEIVKKLNVSPQLVYIVSQSYAGKKPSKKNAVKRPVAVKRTDVADLIAALKTIIKALERA